jgi:hypothetical protein
MYLGDHVFCGSCRIEAVKAEAAKVFAPPYSATVSYLEKNSPIKKQEDDEERVNQVLQSLTRLRFALFGIVDIPDVYFLGLL